MTLKLPKSAKKVLALAAGLCYNIIRVFDRKHAGNASRQAKREQNARSFFELSESERLRDG